MPDPLTTPPVTFHAPQSAPLPSGPIQIQLPPPLVELMQAWPTHVARSQTLETRLGTVEAQLQPMSGLQGRLAALEIAVNALQSHKTNQAGLVGFSCFLLGVVLTCGAVFGWTHW